MRKDEIFTTTHYFAVQFCYRCRLKQCASSHSHWNCVYFLHPLPASTHRGVLLIHSQPMLTIFKFTNKLTTFCRLILESFLTLLLLSRLTLTFSELWARVSTICLFSTYKYTWHHSEIKQYHRLCCFNRTFVLIFFASRVCKVSSRSAQEKKKIKTDKKCVQ